MFKTNLVEDEGSTAFGFDLMVEILLKLVGSADAGWMRIGVEWRGSPLGQLKEGDTL